MQLITTTRCNMHCAHCCFSCGPQGEDMPWGVFAAAVERALEIQPFHYSDSDLNFIGGEPTLHPLLWEMVSHALMRGLDIHVTTNGKNSEVAVELARMAKHGVIGASLSTDGFHETVPMAVYDAFRPGKRSTSRFFEVRYFVDHHDRTFNNYGADSYLAAAGRGKQFEKAKDLCCCPDWTVRASGKVYKCGCADSPQIGSIFESIKTWDLDQVCHRQEAGNWHGLESVVVKGMKGALTSEELWGLTGVRPQ